MALGHPELRGAGSLWPAESSARRVVERLGLDVRELRPLRWKPGQGTPLYYLETPDGRYVLKLPTPRPGKWLPKLRDHLGRQEIEQQARVHALLGSNSYHYLRVPELVASDHRTFLLLEYLETRVHGEHDLPLEAVLTSLLEFQTTRIDLPAAALTSVGRDPGVLLVRRLLSGLRPRLGWHVVAKALRVAAHCYRAQPKLPLPILAHNDFHHNNLLLTRDGQLYFSDFEYVAHEDRWLLGDIVHYAVGTKTFGVAGNLIVDYAARIGDYLGYEFDIASQLRFSLMLRVGQLILSASAPPAVSAQYSRLFTEVLIDDEQFHGWLGELLRAPPATAKVSEAN